MKRLLLLFTLIASIGGCATEPYTPNADISNQDNSYDAPNGK
ncbi:MAG: hypothetical protein JWQ21_424 [Herminiimonas sp.]|nr:hypothetical protein [Herminiimonas sp.]